MIKPELRFISSPNWLGIMEQLLRQPKKWSPQIFLRSDISYRLYISIYRVQVLVSVIFCSSQSSPNERRRKPGSDLILILRSFRDGFRGSFARTVLAFAATGVS